ncbi:hypothetical protein CAPTEDRAFT_191440 [Capitella teleta]|uniref:DNA helicase Pif1-like 2B domain-containing protein n=1 Tax=Capitella teleta TaxID=283909 RepID=R7VJA8_CAPTE|nr:hypothetical protein CAPTEDRAFT_191440 [Capitella teleta]|eukprot:ELU15840.1 hypothetical protein CAPTEDRAFT_191440 [Capitella teleta]
MGNLSQESVGLLCWLQWPLAVSQEQEVIRLCGDDLADQFRNRKCVEEAKGNLVTFKAQDPGDERYLAQFLVPQVLALKAGSRVILLWNIDRNAGLVNAEPEERVEGFAPEVISVKFDNRQQHFLLVLAYALAIHKTESLELLDVEVDVQGIQRPGMLGVAICRVTLMDHLWNLNFDATCMRIANLIADILHLIEPIQEPLWSETVGLLNFVFCHCEKDLLARIIALLNDTTKEDPGLLSCISTPLQQAKSVLLSLIDQVQDISSTRQEIIQLYMRTGIKSSGTFFKQQSMLRRRRPTEDAYAGRIGRHCVLCPRLKCKVPSKKLSYCGDCDREWADGDEWVQCDGCERWFERRCTNMHS